MYRILAPHGVGDILVRIQQPEPRRPAAARPPGKSPVVPLRFRGPIVEGHEIQYETQQNNIVEQVKPDADRVPFRNGHLSLDATADFPCPDFLNCSSLCHSLWPPPLLTLLFLDTIPIGSLWVAAVSEIIVPVLLVSGHKGIERPVEDCFLGSDYLITLYLTYIYVSTRYT